MAVLAQDEPTASGIGPEQAPLEYAEEDMTFEMEEEVIPAYRPPKSDDEEEGAGADNGDVEGHPGMLAVSPSGNVISMTVHPHGIFS
jgi:hypothetical protein